MSITASTRRTVSAATLAAVTASLAIGLAIPTAQAAPATEVREVCAKSVYVKKQPGVIPVGGVVGGQRVEVTRYSPSGRYARIVATQKGYAVRGWVPTRYLCA